MAALQGCSTKAKQKKTLKVIVRSPYGDTDYFVTRVLQGDTLTLFPFIICSDYVLRTSIDLMKESCFSQKQVRSRQYPAETITGADYTYD